MPKDTEGNGEGGEGGGKAKATRSNLKSHLKALIEAAYANEKVDDSENEVTLTLSEGDWAELMEMIDY
jgi:hypothetical protein